MQKYFKEIKTLVILAIPVVFTQIFQTSMGVVDTVMSGTISAIDMAAVSLGTSIWLPIILFGHGILLALTPIVAQMKGSNLQKSIPKQIQQAIWLSIFISIIIMIVLYNSHLLIYCIKEMDSKLAEKSVSFLRCLLWGVPGYLLFQVLRCKCEGLSYTVPSMIISSIGLISNIPINYVLINGKLGFPKFGGIGCGIATSVVYWIMFFSLKIYIKNSKKFKNSKNIFSLKKPNLFTIKKILILGIPLALSLFFEVTLFAMVPIFIAHLGIFDISGHQIALNFSSLMFVLPLSIGSATTIRVGTKLGEKNKHLAKISAISGLIIGILIAILTASFTILMKEKIVFLYNQDPKIVSIASNLMLFSSIYQIFDSIQVIGNGILRGYKDTKSIFLITFFSYWIIAFPFGYILALTNFIVPKMGTKGFWIGFVIGLMVSAVLMISRMIWIQKKLR
ncbi:MATE family efflux transporter [bacterium endosymbiont of Pedicinus badii]|uniref:MATE family efflux transporter n=1 Tax=bacterium endosymbiont of Pedicinus badii TaxID=1719126 RepID=UPI0009BC5B78|nr:MATE family efflux transporter [bacterium endosymbiont of Pedicinus badii]OQM34396.1 MATE family efflux transporter [bacterium endosymbiont of Pedicinus badii]